MFSSALKSFSSNITSNYSISSTPSCVSGPWKIYDGKKRTGGKLVSVFVFERKTLEPPGGSGLGGRGGATSLKRAHDEVVERLRKEASSLARLRHPSILELAEPVEDTRNGGLMFATEPVTASLAGLLEEKNDQEKNGGVGGRNSKYVIEDADGRGRRRREVEIDELEIQKGLLQIGKGLEFLHESAKLVHANLTPDAIFVNAKSDWKISGLGFSSPPDQSTGATSVVPISLSEVLNYDARLPRAIQLNLDYTSPDFVLDTTITTSADMFSLGLIIIALYNSPHHSPVDTGFSVTNYRRIFSSPSTTPTASNNYLCSSTLPKEILASVLPRLITRRPAQRFSAREFQQARYFDSILVSTIGFLDTFPAKTPVEKSQFLRGLPRVLSQFPKSVLEKKILPVLLDETQDAELLSLVLQNIFKVVELCANGQRIMSELVVPRLRHIFLAGAKTKSQAKDRDTAKEGGLKVVLENVSVIAANCPGREFKEDLLPIIYYALESPTHSIIDSALQTLPSVLPVLDFPAIKNELFPAVASVFTKTSSLAIKVRGLEALHVLCGGSANDDMHTPPPDKSGILDKYTVQEKVLPLLKGIKTKEPAVMMAALNVFRQAAQVADSDFCAMDILPLLWQFSLGPLLNLEQFQSFMVLIKSLSSRIEREQTRKLQELSASASGGSTFGGNGLDGHTAGDGQSADVDFESLVAGRKAGDAGQSTSDGGWGSSHSARPNAGRGASQRPDSGAASFSWSSTTSNSAATLANRPAQSQQSSISRAITPDQAMNSFTALTPSNLSATSSSSQHLQAQQQTYASQTGYPSQAPAAASSGSIDWSSAAKPQAAPPTNYGITRMPLQPSKPTYSMTGSTSAPPTMSQASTLNSFRIPPPMSPLGGVPQNNGVISGGSMGGGSTSQKQGLDKYESLI